MNETHYEHPTNDKFLTALSQEDTIFSHLVRSFPGFLLSQRNPSWIDNWFMSRVGFFLANPETEPPERFDPPETLAGLIGHSSIVSTLPFRLLEICPHFFRGFRSLDTPISFPNGLTVIDGPNSSGKTSLAEAFEWLFTGKLVRRTLHELGAPEELESCIGNQLRPDGEQTWVEVTIGIESGEIVHLRRVLVSDYGSTSTSEPSSKLYKEGIELAPEDGINLLESLTLGNPPMLMQHTLRVFVHSSPSERRDYFETLLRLDELTSLIEKAVIGNARLPEFRSPTGAVALTKWESLKQACSERASRLAFTRAERSAPNELRDSLHQTLLSTANIEFPKIVMENSTLEDIIGLVVAEQRSQRQQSFPILEKLRPVKTNDQQSSQIPTHDDLVSQLNLYSDAVSTLRVAEKAAKGISDAEMAVSSSLSALEAAGLISQSPDPQKCPLCYYENLPTLTHSRIQLIHSWSPAREAIGKAQAELSSRIESMKKLLSQIKSSITLLIPDSPGSDVWDEVMGVSTPSVIGSAQKVKQKLIISNEALIPIKRICMQLETEISNKNPDGEHLRSMAGLIHSLSENIPILLSEAREYANIFNALEVDVGALSREDPLYRVREAWLNVASDQESLIIDLGWEKAKNKAQRELESIRDGLISSRKQILDARRGQFSEGMTNIWHLLREDTYSAFSQLFIPEPHGKGFPVKIEVKAILDDGNRQVEVDALRVFSESQVHVLGIAAFLTRVELLGQHCIILDDPVQSMDEEHFKTFASVLLPYLLAQGLQVILLTHNDTFSRDVSCVFSKSDQYTTLKIRHSRRIGCQVEEGNRRALERLKKAETLAEEGKLEDAWKLVRLAIERIYLCVMINYGPPDFDPKSWVSQTAEYMWNEGVGLIITKTSPGLAPRLKGILDMTASGSHDKQSRGQTDLKISFRDLRQLIEELRLGPA
jgi:hypothetical protein